MGRLLALASMTGFSVVTGNSGSYAWSWELRSVNSRSLDLRIRLPSGFEQIESDIRNQIAEKFSRGNIFVHLLLSAPEKQTHYQINEKAFTELYTASAVMAKKYEMPTPMIDTLLGLRGVVEIVEQEPSAQQRQVLYSELKKTFSFAAEKLSENRLEEGQRLQAVIEDVVKEIDLLVNALSRIADEQKVVIQRRLSKKINEILDGDERLAPERLAQEVAFIMAKSDIKEERDRLQSHISATRALLDTDEPVGRKLDFLCQEFNREVNTICSKAATIDITDNGLALKAAIDRIREQVQNIE